MALILPQEFETSMKLRLGLDFQPFIQSLETASPVSIRYNPHKKSEQAGERIPWSTWGHYLSERPVFTLDPGFHAGAYYVQEASSMLLEQALVQTLDLTKSLNVLDLCAAPGGKSTLLLSLISPRSLLISNEVIRNRTSVLSENIQKWGHDNVIITSNDPGDFQRLPGFFDLVVIDAPCSGEGLFRKDPGATKEWSPRNVEMCSLRQRRIVNDAWACLKPGGILIYSTCTYNEAENMDNAAWIRDTHGAESLSLSMKEDWGIEEIMKNHCTGYQCFPHHVRGEGFFLSVLRKTSGEHRTQKSKNTLKYPSANQIKDMAPWILTADSSFFFQHHETIRMLPSAKQEEFQVLLNNLHVVIGGTAVLELSKNKFIPDHALALSIRLNKNQFPVIKIDIEQALAYLRKETLRLDSHPFGFALIEYNGLGLGWVNVLQNRINNLYPATWRIRM